MGPDLLRQLLVEARNFISSTTITAYALDFNTTLHLIPFHRLLIFHLTQQPSLLFHGHRGFIAFYRSPLLEKYPRISACLIFLIIRRLPHQFTSIIFQPQQIHVSSRTLHILTTKSPYFLTCIDLMFSATLSDLKILEQLVMTQNKYCTIFIPPYLI